MVSTTNKTINQNATSTDATTIPLDEDEPNRKRGVESKKKKKERGNVDCNLPTVHGTVVC